MDSTYLTSRQRAAVEFFSQPRTFEECADVCNRWGESWQRVDTAISMHDLEERVTDIFMMEMVDLDLHFQR